jgi:hypothetical protein
MISKCFWRVCLAIALSVAFSTNTQADTLQHDADVALVAAIAVVAALVVVTVVLVHHSLQNRAITGCVVSGESGMLLTNEKDKRVYTLAGNTAAVRAGDRVTLQGKKIKINGGDKLTWETRTVKDLGACRP